MEIRPIVTEADYDRALQDVEAYFDNEPAPGTPEADRFDVLSALIEHYEARHWPIEAPTPIEAIRFRMEAAGYTQRDLAELLGSRSRASELLSRKRHLTLDQAFRLHSQWGIPAEVLLKPYHLAAATGPRAKAKAS